MSSETRFQELQRYVRFGPDDSAHLRALAPTLTPHFRSVVDEFYLRTREHTEAHAVFKDEAQIERLKNTLERWMKQLFDGPHDEAYFLERSKIGRMHVRVGLPQRYVFTSMAVLRGAFARLTLELLPAHQAGLTLRSLEKILDLELAIMLETYQEDSIARLQRVEHDQKEELRKALLRAEQRFGAAVESGHMFALGIDATRSIVWTNRGIEEALGYARDELLLHPFEQFVPANQRNTWRELLTRCQEARSGPCDSAELALVTRTGRERLVRWQPSHEYSDTPNERVVFLFGQDITEERESRERVLRNERLAAVGTLAAGLAHEIRNPLNGALLHLTFLERSLKRGVIPEQSLDAVLIVADELKRLSALVRDFLVFARPSPPHKTPTRVRDLCLRVAGLGIGETELHRARLTTDLDLPEDFVLELDREKIEQVLLNLLRNAMEAVGTVGGGAVTLRVRRRPAELVLEVQDEGPGLPSVDAPVFDAFFSTKPNGTGLGLSIVQRIVSDHQGQVDVESQPGRTVFRVRLPVVENAGTT